MKVLRSFQLILFTCFGLLAPTLTAFAGDIVVGSWNIQRLGHGDQKSYPALASIASKVDLLAVQEVMNEDGIKRLELALEKHTGESWSYMASHALGSSSYKEMYAFIWKDSAVKYSTGAAVYLDLEKRFMREPFSAKFKSKRDGSEIALGTVHIVYGKSIQDRIPEIKALADYWLWMKETYAGTPIALVGDFNLAESNAAWGAVKVHAKPLITKGATTLSANPGRFANLYDNIWVERNTALNITDAGIINFPKIIGWDHVKSRKHVSDHAPVYMVLGSAKLGNKAVNAMTTQPTSPAKVSRQSPASNNIKSIKGNSNSKIYHLPEGCPSYSKVSPSNAVIFKSERDAVAAGYRKAGNCS